jgi:hypothetical protein
MDQPSINQSMGSRNRNITVNAVQNLGPSLESDIQGAVRDLETDLGRYGLPPEYGRKLAVAEQILRQADHATLVDWMDCRRKPNTAEAKVRALLCFLVNAMLIEERIVPPTPGGTQMVLRGKPSWLFQIPRGEAEPLALHLTELIQFFQKIPDCEIRNGTAFLARLSQVLTCEACIGDGVDTSCVRGVVRDWLMGDTGADLEGNGQITDFFAQLEPRNLTIKCGNCIVDVQRTAQIRQVLGGE